LWYRPLTHGAAGHEALLMCFERVGLRIVLVTAFIAVMVVIKFGAESAIDGAGIWIVIPMLAGIYWLACVIERKFPTDR
jgi:hypothetical protein